VVERPYVDRHYIEEFSRYYATSLWAPSPHTTRLHFFSQRLTEGEFHALLDGIDDDESFAAAQQKLQQGYLGAVVIRPIPSAPIGRTLLRPYLDSSSRRFETTNEHRIHLAGLELTVDTVPFQQQEEAVGACATTAVWSALSAVSRKAGRRGPTPFQVTEAATRHVLQDRRFPASAGLSADQVLSAVESAEFAPLVLRPDGAAGPFAIALKCYLSSGIPVVLFVTDEESGEWHAITVVGFREADEHYNAAPIVVDRGADRVKSEIKSAGFARLYIHEDRLGPFARMNWIVEEDGDDPADASVFLEHEPYSRRSYKYGKSRLRILRAIVPHYPKLRLSARGLLKAASAMYPPLRLWLGEERRTKLRVDLRFELGGQYLSELLRLGLEKPSRVGELARTLTLPRYVGLARFSVGDEAFLDVVYDSTDIYRDTLLYGNIIAIVCLVPSYIDDVNNFVRRELHRADEIRVV
jgi:hypothetical protein